MHAHLVSVIKYRHQLFTSRHLEQIMPDVCAESGCEPAELNGEPGHVHLPVNFLPTIAVSHLASSLKGVPSRRLRPAFPDLHRHYWRSTAAVVRSHFAGSAGGAPISGRASISSSTNVPPDQAEAWPPSPPS